jgi:hypothetical protein
VVTLLLKHHQSSVSWWLSTVYGPQLDADKLSLLHELRASRNCCSGPWLLCGDFNLIYKAKDKSNARLNRRVMSAFRQFLDNVEVLELHLHGRLYTWSSEQVHPTLIELLRVLHGCYLPPPPASGNLFCMLWPCPTPAAY